MSAADRAQAGQANVELVGAVAVLGICALVAFQLFTIGRTRSAADNAATAAAIALVNGRDPAAAARAAARDWRPRDVKVRAVGEEVRVSVPAPPVLRALHGRATVTARAVARHRPATPAP